MPKKMAKILIVDDSQQELRIHATTLRSHGYDVVTAGNGEEALFLVEAGVPDLFLIDTNMKDMDGYALCERLKEDSRLLNVPVIFITNTYNPDNIDRGYSVGGVDYIVKPCHLSEFLAKVRTHISLYQLLLEVQQLREAAIDANPLTHLPGNNSIVKMIQEAVDQHQDVAVIYSDLDNFKSYNDVYGFSAGDNVLLFCAEVLRTALKTLCSDNGFLGHIGGDDFVLIVPSEKVEVVADAITRNFDSGAPDFYDEVDRRRGHIVTKDRNGETVQFPLVGISLGGVLLRQRNYTRFVEVANVCAEVKHQAKSIVGSNLFLDRRTDDPSPTPERAAPGDDVRDETAADDPLAVLTES